MKPARLIQPLTQAFALLGTAIAALGVGSFLAVTVPLPGAISPGEGQRLLGDLVRSGFQYQLTRPVTVLVMGIDGVPGAQPGSDEIFAGRSDTMLLLRLDPSNQTVNLLSVPRDTQVEIPGIGRTKINQANASGGPALARQVVQSTLNNVPIDRYVRVSTDAFKELVNLLGGVDVYVPEDMSYKDDTQKLYINLKKGQQHLDGVQAEGFARFRHDAFGDIGRVQRQQILLKALRAQLSSPLVLPRIPGILQTMQKYIDTNLSFEEMLALVNFGLKLDQKNVKMVMLPGRFSAPNEFRASYWIMNDAGRDRVMEQYFGIGNGTPQEASIAGLKIAVQNASSNPKAAQEVVGELLQLGYTNVFVTDPWSETQAQTQIIVQGGQLKSAESLRDLLKLGSVDASSTGDLESDLTIRVGDDWSQHTPSSSKARN